MTAHIFHLPLAPIHSFICCHSFHLRWNIHTHVFFFNAPLFLRTAGTFCKRFANSVVTAVRCAAPHPLLKGSLVSGPPVAFFLCLARPISTMLLMHKNDNFTEIVKSMLITTELFNPEAYLR